MDEQEALLRRWYWREVRYYLCRQNGRDPGPQERAVASYDGGQDRFGRCYKPVWPKLVSRFTTLAIDAQEGLRLLFESWQGSLPPRPNQLLTAVIDSQKTQAVRDELYFRLRSETDILRRALRLATAGKSADRRLWRAVLCNDALDISPLLRYYFGQRLQDRAVLDLYQQAATVQYYASRYSYESLLGKNLADWFLMD